MSGLKGRIKNINSTKYVVDINGKDFICCLRGIFRKTKTTPLVGDFVEINDKDMQIIKIFERRNFLRRPNIANVDYALIITSVKKPDLDLILLDKLLVNIYNADIDPIICFTKVDLLNEEEKKDYLIIKNYYESVGYKVIENTELDKFKIIVENKVIVCCGQTGAGKSTFINKIDSTLFLETNPISESLNRGVHTTRYVSLYKIDNYYIADTPGFSALDLSFVDDKVIRFSFPEFQNYDCKYKDCNHINTDGCEVVKNVGGNILQSRYDNYKKFLKEKNESSSKFFK